jgi:3-ketosteroid 9alpha-monooxygenase subunit B
VPDHAPVLREHGYHSLRVTRVVTETRDASSFVLDVPAELREAFGYRPGQFCTFRVRLDGEVHLRSYSMSSAPDTDPDLTVTVKRVAGGLVSNWFLDTVAVGSVLELTKPAGVFCPQETERPVLCFCGGSGVTPVMSIAKHVLASTERPVRLLYANRDAASVIFDDALEQLRARYPARFEVRHHLDDDRGFVTADDVAGFAGGSLDADVYICGPGPFMDLVETTLQELGVGPERLYVERFLVEQQEKDAALTTDAAAAADADVAVAGMRPGADSSGDAGVPAEVTVILGGKSVVIRYQRGDTLLETARRGGLRPPFSCESGNCATCMAFLKEGAADMRANNALTPEEIDEGWILTCQGLPKGKTVTVEYEAM